MAAGPLIRAADPRDLGAILDLLARCELPVEDVAERLAGFWVGDDPRRGLAGTIGLERRGDTGLLRSLAVEPQWRGSGLARELCLALTRKARAEGLRELWLLTTTAPGFFARIGFAREERAAVPEPIRGTREFAALCPASAVAMRLALDAEEVHVRTERPADHAAVEAIHRAAFDGEIESAIVRRLRGTDPRVLSLVADCHGSVAGHALFTPVVAGDGPGACAALALGPMAVDPSLQRRGLGSALVRCGLEICRERGEPLVFVLGHADYYPRFGFRPAAAAGFRFRDERFDPHFFVLELAPSDAPGSRGEVRYDPAFDDA